MRLVGVGLILLWCEFHMSEKPVQKGLSAKPQRESAGGKKEFRTFSQVDAAAASPKGERRTRRHSPPPDEEPSGLSGPFGKFLGGVLVFILVGLTPTVFRIVNNYTLELSRPEDHPVYLSTLSICIAAPAIASPLVGLIVDRVGFTPVFLVIGSVIGLAWLLTFTLSEPRHSASDEV